MTPKQQARLGLFHIEEAILEVLFQANDEYTPAADIARKIGITQSYDQYSWIVAPILNKLAEDGRVEPRIVGTQKRGWKLSERERNRRAVDDERD